MSAGSAAYTAVLPTSSVRIQFSRDLAPLSLKGRVRIEYAPAPGGGAAATPITDFTTEYRGAARVLEVKFTKPLAHLRTVHVTFNEGVVGTDQQGLKSWSLSFETAP